MRSKGLLVLVAVCVIAFMTAGASNAVVPTLTDSYAGTAANCAASGFGSLANPPRYTSLQNAINNTVSGGTVHVCRGTFGPATVDRPMTIMGVTRATLISNCSSTTASDPTKDSVVDGAGGQFALDIEASNVSVSGLVIRNAQWGVVINLAHQDGRYGGLNFSKNVFEANEDGLFPDFNAGSANTINANCFRNQTQDAIASGWGPTNTSPGGTIANLTISSNKFVKNPYATIVLASPSNHDFKITGNVVTGDGMFLGLINASNFEVSGNIVNQAAPPAPGTMDDAVFHFGGNNTGGTIARNIVQSSTQRGIAFDQVFAPTINSAMTVQGNIFQGLTTDGFTVKAQSLKQSTISGNIVTTKGTNGLFITGGGNTQNSWSGNIFTGLTWGCHVTGSLPGQNWNGTSNIGHTKNTGGTCFP